MQKYTDFNRQIRFNRSVEDLSRKCKVIPVNISYSLQDKVYLLKIRNKILKLKKEMNLVQNLPLKALSMMIMSLEENQRTKIGCLWKVLSEKYFKHCSYLAENQYQKIPL